jgi:hypothetical protein
MTTIVVVEIEMVGMMLMRMVAIMLMNMTMGSPVKC